MLHEWVAEIPLTECADLVQRAWELQLQLESLIFFTQQNVGTPTNEYSSTRCCVVFSEYAILQGAKSTLYFYMMNINTKILTLDMAGVPRRWEDLEKVVEYYAKDKIAWDIGDFTYTMRGGIQRTSGLQSEITVRSIVAIKGTEHLVGKERTPVLSRRMLFQRDRCTCAYCGTKYDERQLEQEHIVPRAQGGKSTWTNLVTACYHCNDIKGNRTPEQAGMPLRYLPFVPSRWEMLLLSNRNILADQMELLMSKSKHFKTHPRGEVLKCL